MYDIEKILSDYGFTPKTYEEALNICGKKVHRETDIGWDEISDRYDIEFAGDSIRKAQQLPIFGGAFVNEYHLSKQISDKEMKEDERSQKLKVEIEKLLQLKQEVSDQRLDANKFRREIFRKENVYKLLNDNFASIGDKRYGFDINTNQNIINMSSSGTVIVCLSDLHIGETFCGYNVDIATGRLQSYLNQILKTHNSFTANKCILVISGDLINGSIHKTISITNKEDVIEQIKIASELLSDFTYALANANIFNEILVVSVPGNHSRMEQNKDDALIDERLDLIIPWFMKTALRNVPYIQFADCFDNTYSKFMIGDKLYVVVHGDYDIMTEIGILKLSSFIGDKIPYCIISGHLHTFKFNEVSGVNVIQVGSLCGSGNQLTRKKRLVGKASQAILTCDSCGEITSVIPVYFK